MWAKAKSKLDALIRLCGDGVVLKESSENEWGRCFGTEICPLCTPSCTVLLMTHQRTVDAPRWCSRLAMDVGEGQKQARCIDSPVRRRGGVE